MNDPLLDATGGGDPAGDGGAADGVTHAQGQRARPAAPPRRVRARARRRVSFDVRAGTPASAPLRWCVASGAALAAALTAAVIARAAAPLPAGVQPLHAHGRDGHAEENPLLGDVGGDGGGVAADCAVSGCSGAGTCLVDGRCRCDIWHAGAACEVGAQWDDASEGQRLAWTATAAALNGALVCVAGRDLARRLRHSAPRRRQLRDVTSFVVLLAAYVRLLWLLCPPSRDAGDPLGNAVDAALLRLPQVGWFAGYFGVLLLWDGVVSAVRPSERRSRRLRAAAAAVVVLVGVCVLAGQATALHLARSPPGPLRRLAVAAQLVANNVLAATGVAVVPITLWAARQVMLLLRHVELLTRSAEATGMAKVLHSAQRATVVALAWMAVGVAALTALVVLQLCAGLPRGIDYALFHWTVHCFVEPVFCGAVAYCAYGSTAAERAASPCGELPRWMSVARCCASCTYQPRRHTQLESGEAAWGSTRTDTELLSGSRASTTDATTLVDDDGGDAAQRRHAGAAAAFHPPSRLPRTEGNDLGSSLGAAAGSFLPDSPPHAGSRTAAHGDGAA